MGWYNSQRNGRAGKGELFCILPTLIQSRSEYQYAPLQLILDIKQEDFRRKARLVAGGHVADASMYESYSSTM